MDIEECAEIKAQEWLELVEAEPCGECDCDCANCQELPESLREQAE